ncbi:MAG: DUF898 domain-containing protein [Pseudomonadales bacterium]|nr:DUF898 domain-containing protein [Pseudomonadales bacterium]
MDDLTAGSTAAPDNTPRTLNIEFRGNGMEYFKIWIINILLTALTLGIYSAWATVKNKRYMHANLFLDETNFRYLAEPLAILKGRIIAIAAFIAFALLSQIDPIVGVILIVALVLAIPYFTNQSLAFDRRMTSYNNIQFRFKSTYAEAFMVLYVWPLLGLLSLGILYPMALLKMNQYLVKNSAYGTTSFDFKASYKDYGMIFLTIIGAGLVLGLPCLAITSFFPSLTMVTPVVMMLGYIGLILYFMTQTHNLFFRSTTLDEHSFESQISMGGLGLVILINALLTMITLGLYLPAAKVRMAKYVCSCVKMNTVGCLNNFAAAEQENISALGEEFGQVFDFAL